MHKIILRDFVFCSTSPIRKDEDKSKSNEIANEQVPVQDEHVSKVSLFWNTVKYYKFS